MTNLKLSPSIPSWIEAEIYQLKKHLSSRQVDNNLNLFVDDKKYDQKFFLLLYSNVREWGL